MRVPALLISGIATLVGTSITTAASAAEAKAISKACGPATVTIACSPHSEHCTQTTLSLSAEHEAPRALPKPKGLADYTAVAFACVSARDGTRYISVQYGALPEGCAFCEWMALYSVKGELLTGNDPPMISDASLPEGHQQYPNNREYAAISKQLGLTKPKFEFFPQGDRTE
jgi:hypothetical protein